MVLNKTYKIVCNIFCYYNLFRDSFIFNSSCLFQIGIYLLSILVRPACWLLTKKILRRFVQIPIPFQLNSFILLLARFHVFHNMIQSCFCEKLTLCTGQKFKEKIVIVFIGTNFPDTNRGKDLEYCADLVI